MYRFIFSILLAGCCSALAQRNGENSGGKASDKAPLSDSSERLSFQADLFTGRFGYQVPLELAPGRHSSAPSLALSYSSSSENTWCGVGWDLNPGFIQRVTKHGVPVRWTNGAPVKAYDDTKGFTFSLNGRSSDLVKVGVNEYRAEVEGGFMRFLLVTNSNQWQVTDPSGNLYYFGQSTASRMSNSKSGWPSNAWNGTFRWALSKVQNVLGDTNTYTYTNIGGALYPLKVTYNGHTNGQPASHAVDFILATRTNDVTSSFISGYRVEQNQRLAAIVHKVSGYVVWSNRLAYTQSPSSGRSLLQSVTRYGSNLVSALPPLGFGYSTQSFGFKPLSYWGNLSKPPGWNDSYYSVSATDGGRLYLDLVDMDGDGLADRVYQPMYGPYTSLYVQHNNGAGFDNPVPYGPLSSESYNDGVNGTFTSYDNVDFTAVNAAYMRTLDINGDGYPDRVMDPIESFGTSNRYSRFAVQLNAGNNLGGTASWTNVVSSTFAAGDPAVTYWQAIEQDGRVAMLDMNGDGLPDRLMVRQYGVLISPTNEIFTNYWVQFNTGSGFSGTNVFGPLNYDLYSHGYGKSISGQALRMLDINGDGLPDRVMYATNTAGGPIEIDLRTNLVVELNNGYGFEPPVSWGGIVPVYRQGGGPDCSANDYYNELDIGDNSDRVYRDINGDGLPDRIYRYHDCAITNLYVQINTGTNFADPQPYGPYYSQYNMDFSALESGITRFVDIDGDGLPDHVMGLSPFAGPQYAVELSKGPFPDLLSVISNGIGGSVQAAYTPSTRYDNRDSASAGARQLLPFPVQTVSAVSVSDGLNPSNTTTYAYSGGMWSAARREFHGFAQVTVTDPLGLTNVHWFHQAGGRDNSALGEYADSAAAIGKNGLPFRVETIGSNGLLYKLVLNRVQDADLGNGRHFGYISQTLTLDYPGEAPNNNYRAAAQGYAYDLNTGNLLGQTNYGEVGSVVVADQGFIDNPAQDAIYQATTYAGLSNTNILDKPQHAILSADPNGQTILRESWFEYDHKTGNLLQKRERMCESCFVTNSFVYDNFNSETNAVNEAGIATATTYDTLYHAFPAQQVVGGTLTNTFTYDGRSGQLIKSVDAKGLVVTNRYDIFLRLISTYCSTVPNGTVTNLLCSYTYSLGGIGANGYSTNSVQVQRNDGREIWTYFDGLGRTLQVREEAEGSNGFRVTDTVYDQRGNVRFETLPYFSAGTKHTRLANSTKPGTLREYDALARLAKVTAGVNGTFNPSSQLSSNYVTGGDTGSPLGSTSLAYNDGAEPWAVVCTDEENKTHKYLLDAYGRTNQIVEPGNFTTGLGYNLAGDLTSITNNTKDVIEYAYNDRGQMVAMADPDLGRWDYRHDFAGRLREQQDAKTNLIRFDYTDSLGRLKAKLVYNPAGTFVYAVTNYYDGNQGDAAYTVYPGQLYMITDSEGWTKYSYDVRGRTLKSVRCLSKNGQSYTNQFAYDNADRVTQTIYPAGGPTITNIYDTGGNLSRVKQVGGSNTVFYNARGFNELGQLVGIDFGNGATTTNDYYAISKRLRQVVTYKSGSTNIQNLIYSYDRVSNLTNLADAIYSGSASAAMTAISYDDLHRLKSLTRPAIGQTTSFTYDSIGNLTVNGESGAGSYNYGVRMPHAVKSANGKHYAYDPNGNMIVRDGQRLDYDPENRLTLVTNITSATTFGYDAGGARLWKQSSGTNGLQVWIGGNYEEKDGKVLFHVLGGGQTVCTFDATGTNVFEYYHPDHLHSTAILTDQNGYRIQHHEYSAFGQDRFTESSTAFHLSKRYTGQVLDEDTGLYYYGARYYAPELGRFIQPDDLIPEAANPQSYNRYSYSFNNPLKYVDPDGHAPQLTGFIFDQKTGGTQLQYMDYKFGQGYGIGLHGPIDKPTLVLAHEVLNQAAEATYDPSVGAGEATRLYVAGTCLVVLGVTDFVPGGKQVSTPLRRPAEKALEKAVERKLVKESAKRGPKIGLEGLHNQKIKEVADQLEAAGNTIIAGGKRPDLPEAVIPTVGGHKQARRPDILYETPSGNRQAVNVGKTKVDGTPVKREAQALNDLNQRGGVPTQFVPYGR